MLTPFDLIDHYYSHAPYMADARAYVDMAALRARRQQRAQAFCEPSLAPLFAALEPLASLPKPASAGWRVQDGHIVLAEDLPASWRPVLNQALSAFMPWKKGPFHIAGIEIDGEWRSDHKWERLLPHCAPLHDRRVLDIGCHNGYFMWRMAEAGARHVIGFEPVARHALLFHCLQNLAPRDDRLAFELLGIEDTDLFQAYFDTVFCLGILYHHTDPVGLLRKIHRAMAKGGELVVDVQGIPGQDPLCLVPATRYAGSKGVWFLPTATAASHWLSRAGFRDGRVIHSAPLDSHEQRTTAWAPIPSLAEHLDTKDPTHSCEGYPAPWRHYLVAVK